MILQRPTSHAKTAPAAFVIALLVPGAGGC